MNKRIIIVDDSATIRRTVYLTLRGAGIEVLEAGDDIEALLPLEGEEIDMLITDLNMPRLDWVARTRQEPFRPWFRRASLFDAEFPPVSIVFNPLQGELK